MQRPGLKTAGAVTRGDVERAVMSWLEEHAGDQVGLSAWEAHCFAVLITFLRYGYYERALEQLAYVLEPPIPLPAFPLRQLMTLDQVRAAFPPRPANDDARYRERGDGPRASGD